jgi:hypothetical protein
LLCVGADVGARFYLGLAGVTLAIGAAVGIGLLIFYRAIYAWGVFGAFIILSAVMLLLGWIYDRRQAHRYDEP